MSVIKYGALIAVLTLSTAAFAASDSSISGSGQGATANQPNGATEQMGGATRMEEGRAAKTGPADKTQDVPNANGGAPKMGNPPAANDNQN